MSLENPTVPAPRLVRIVCDHCRVTSSRTDNASPCPVCEPRMLAPDHLSRVLADGIEVVAEERHADAAARQLLSVVVRRLGIRGVLQLMADGADTMVSVADDEDAPVVVSRAELAALRALATELPIVARVASP